RLGPTIFGPHQGHEEAGTRSSRPSVGVIFDPKNASGLNNGGPSRANMGGPRLWSPAGLAMTNSPNWRNRPFILVDTCLLKAWVYGIQAHILWTIVGNYYGSQPPRPSRRFQFQKNKSFRQRHLHIPGREIE